MGNTQVHQDNAQKLMLGAEERKAPVFAGPSSAIFSFQVADLVLRDQCDPTSVTKQRDQITGVLTEDEVEVCLSPEEELNHECAVSQDVITRSEAIRLARVYSDVINLLHPILDMQSILGCVDALYAAGGNVIQQATNNMSHMKMAIAIALLAEKGGVCATAAAIYQSIKPQIADVTLSHSFSLDGQILLIMTAFFHMYTDDLRLATRVVAVTARIAIEAGLHRRNVLLQRFPDGTEQKKVLIMMFTLSVIDRQLNFNSGLPFTMRDIELEVPKGDDLPPYVKAMASYVDFGAQAWAAILDTRGRLKRQFEETNYQFLSYQVIRWIDSLPDELKPQQYLVPPNGKYLSMSEQDSATCSLRCILHLRANQIKILILRPLLFSAQSAQEKPRRVSEVGQVAIDTIDRIVEFHQRTDLCDKQWPILNQFLSSALSTLLLLYIHLLDGLHLQSVEPAPIDIQIVGQGIRSAVDLVQIAKNRSSQRLWKLLNSPSGLLQRLGLDLGAGKSQNSMDISAGSSTGTCAGSCAPLELEPASGEGISQTNNCIPVIAQSQCPALNHVGDCMDLEGDLFGYFGLAGGNNFDAFSPTGMYMPMVPNQFDNFFCYQ
ncbi:hypothetical protein LTR84_011450 [Exophiala bonariae]|uniref:Transcription factor domain-containing protein n=1 Tax=Exophiala bonariae TaxID=1690606 RepID=A0AAV9MUE7_9EURO|nr:hypothetical protein LTR84_011450 [Exophiala bonariae]